MAAIAGKVAITPKGEWDIATQYEKLDFVLHGDTSYVARKESVGVEPGTDDEVWMLSLRGASAQQIQDIINGTTTVGNADELDGRDSNQYMRTYKGYGNGTNVHDSYDLNDWVMSGAYSCVNGTQGTLNYPSDTDGWGTVLVVSGTEGRTFQIFHAWDKSAKLYWRSLGDTTWSDWHDFTAFLSLAGGIVNGTIYVKDNPVSVYNSLQEIWVHAATSGKAGIWSQTFQKWLLNVTSDGSVSLDGYTPLHTGNKPSGSYTGNGDATERAITISPSGINSGLLITDDKGTAIVFVTAIGAFSVNTSGSTAFIPYSRMHFVGGVLTIVSANQYVNTSGTVYTYRAF